MSVPAHLPRIVRKRRILRLPFAVELSFLTLSGVSRIIGSISIFGELRRYGDSRLSQHIGYAFLVIFSTPRISSKSTDAMSIAKAPKNTRNVQTDQN